jgi:GNAT superfamily N-acetyltransferase
MDPDQDAARLAPVAIRPFDPRELGEARLAGLRNLYNAVNRETRPDDPPRPVDYFRNHFITLAQASEFHRRFWLAETPREVVGSLTASRRRTGGNEHVLHLELLVRPDARRRGTATALVREAAAFARAHDQTVLIGLVTGHEPLRERPGGRFLSVLGGRPGLAHRIYRLELDAIDVDMLRSWAREGAERSPDVEAVWKLGPFEPGELEAVSRIMRAMNSAPRGDLKTGPTNYTPESVAQRDRITFAEGFERTALFLRDRRTRALLGYTMMLVDPHDERLLRQADTAVDPAARGRGLGKWLKAAMLLRALRDHPTRSEVRTGTADDNLAMLDINRRIGFRPWLAHSVWQVDLPTLQDAIAKRTPPD